MASSDAGFQGSSTSWGWQTVSDSHAYEGQYSETNDPSATASYTFSNLAPGNYEFWAQYSAGSTSRNVSLSVDDGTASGSLLQTLSLDEQTALSSSSPGVRSYGPYAWVCCPHRGGSTAAMVYANSGTITVTLPYAGANTEAPTLWLVPDPQSTSSLNPGTLGGLEVSKDSVLLANGQINLPAAAAGVPVYNNLLANNVLANDPSVTSIFGNGQNSGFPLFIGGGTELVALNLPSCPTTMKLSASGYTPQYGTKDTLVNTGSSLVLTEPDGTVYRFLPPTGAGPTPPRVGIDHPARRPDYIGDPVDRQRPDRPNRGTEFARRPPERTGIVYL